MAILLLSSVYAPGNFHFFSKTPRFPSAKTFSTVRAKIKQEEVMYDDVAIVWFKQDLRIDDHPGLVLASRCRTVVPVYVFDRRILRGYSDDKLKLVFYALEDLRKSLNAHGSNLLLLVGNSEDEIMKLVKEVKATHLFAEDEIEYTLVGIIDEVKEYLSRAYFPWGDPQFVSWNAPLYDIKNLKELPTNYCDFQKLRLPLMPVLAPSMLPEIETNLGRGSLPTFDDVKRYVDQTACERGEKWFSIKGISPEAISKKEQLKETKKSSGDIGGIRNLFPEASTSAKSIEDSTLEKSILLPASKGKVAGGTDAVLNSLAAYLRYLEGTARDDWKEVHERLQNNESRKGASFGVMFGPFLHLGIISRRRAYLEAIKYERERNAGFLSPFGYSTTTVAAVADGVCSMEWYWLLGLENKTGNENKSSIRIWRWKGYSIQYTVSGTEGPVILLVHGFGAFLEHYRDNIPGIANSGNRVWAITLLGFGKSEKPNIVYTEIVWAELLRDFIVDIVCEPVHLVGNSIGGYCVALVSGFWPSLVQSVVLINTAGSIVPGYCLAQQNEVRQTPGGALLARLLLLYLRSRARNILKDCYPTNMERADDSLVNEILRASYDPGVLQVLESVFNFNLSVPLNYLLDAFGGKVLVIQGNKDPISKSKLRLSMIKEHCSQVVIKELEAGHCPHDELPDKVNAIICEWVSSKVVALECA